MSDVEEAAVVHQCIACALIAGSQKERDAFVKEMTRLGMSTEAHHTRERADRCVLAADDEGEAES